MLEDLFPEVLLEGVYDRFIFKAIFVVGGPGSGKTYIIRKLIAPHGFRHSDVDKIVELLSRKRGIALHDVDYDEGEYRDIHQTSIPLMKTRLSQYIMGRLPLAIDTTGRSYSSVIKLKNHLEDIGYDCGMLVVNTDLETAQRRNATRERRIRPSVVAELHRQVRDNLGRFQNLFGQENFFIVDSSEEFDFEDLWKRIKKWASRPVQNPEAIRWIEHNIKVKQR